jgi:hypothetical protein
MADGSERHIEDVRLGEQVVTAEGRRGRVSGSMLRDETGGLLRLRLWGHSHLRMTREHPVLTDHGYVEAKDLAIGDVVALPRYASDSPTVVIRPRELVRRHRVGSAVLPEKIELTPHAGRLFGLWLAEGSADGTKVRWHYGGHEGDTLVPETVRLCRAVLGVEAHAAKRPNGTWWVTVYGTPWNALFKLLGGDRVDSKRPHPLLTSGDREFLAAMLDGWLAGDGCHKPNGAQEGVSVSGDLALAMYDIAQMIGRRPVIVHSESPQNAADRYRLPRWTLTMARHPDAHNYSSQDESHVWRSVRELVVEDYVGPVYDLTVDGDHSYVAEGVGVHNCTANAIGAAIEFDQMKQKLSDVFVPSRLYIYYNERSLEGTVASDSGAQIRDGIKTVASQGACHEALWPYDITKFADKPPTNCYDDGAKNKAVTYQRLVSTPTQLKGCLASGYPFVFGFTVYESFESQQVASTGHAPVPASGEKVLGGHAVMAVGYDDASQWFVVRNSWGTGWGMAGYFTLPYAYLSQQGLSSDFWTVRLVS